ncbi:AAA family ATPase [Desulfonema magnum]|uniref:AAA ATPase-like domain-containing protein n=1 Tax=Desulfonema magnum TaxID=45655 RepID=A0A975BR38_9BACT|nr:ATP-binding protein [Desulfonema magnum]QTA89882.1 AAA ATPase-like domain-containing protein [Desulfonema magnum]
MKIARLHLTDHPLFGTIDIDFTDPEENPSDTIVLAGINGSGKTTILNCMKGLLKKGIVRPYLKESFKGLAIPELGEKFYLDSDTSEYIVPFFTSFENETIQKFRLTPESGYRENITNVFETYAENPLHDKSEQNNLHQLPKLIYLPSEINFDRIQITARPYKYVYHFFNEVDENIAKFIPDYFGTLIDKKVYENEDIPPRESIRKACDDINSIFEKLDLESKLVGLKKDGSRMPIFKNKTGKEFDINGLSSGEKQLFFRIMALKMFEVNNSVILVDEPENSLHPAWQQKILKIYENIGENNQVIVATHSSHIIASTPKENVKILARNEEINTFQVIDYSDVFFRQFEKVRKHKIS